MKKWTFLLLLMVFTARVGAGENAPDVWMDDNDMLAIELLPFDSAPLALRLFDITSDDVAYLQRPPALMAYLEEPLVRPVFKSERNLMDPTKVLPQHASLTFKPSAEHDYKSWKVQVVDGHGRVVKEMRGVGTPGLIQWDGTEDGWMRLRAGEPYNMVFQGDLMDGSGIREVGQPVVFNAVALKTGGRTMILFAAGALFSRGRVPALSDDGKDWLAAVASAIADRMEDPVTIDIFAKDLVRAAKQREEIISSLSNMLMRSADEWMTELQVDPNEEEEIRISILGGPIE